MTTEASYSFGLQFHSASDTIATLTISGPTGSLFQQEIELEYRRRYGNLIVYADWLLAYKEDGLFTIREDDADCYLQERTFYFETHGSPVSVKVHMTGALLKKINDIGRVILKCHQEIPLRHDPIKMAHKEIAGQFPDVRLN